MCPSRCWLAKGHLGALIGIWWKLGNPARRLLHLHVSVALLVGEGALGRVDRDLVEIGQPGPPAAPSACVRRVVGWRRGTWESGTGFGGNWATRPAGCSICMCPSRCWLAKGHLGRVDRDLVEVGRTQPRELRVVIG